MCTVVSVMSALHHLNLRANLCYTWSLAHVDFSGAVFWRLWKWKKKIYFLGKKLLFFWKNWKPKIFLKIVKYDLQNWSLDKSVGFIKTIFIGDLQKEVFKTIKNTAEFALKICLKEHLFRCLFYSFLLCSIKNTFF